MGEMRNSSVVRFKIKGKKWNSVFKALLTNNHSLSTPSSIWFCTKLSLVHMRNKKWGLFFPCFSLIVTDATYLFIVFRNNYHLKWITFLAFLLPLSWNISIINTFVRTKYLINIFRSCVGTKVIFSHQCAVYNQLKLVPLSFEIWQNLSRYNIRKRKHFIHVRDITLSYLEGKKVVTAIWAPASYQLQTSGIVHKSIDFIFLPKSV